MVYHLLKCSDFDCGNHLFRLNRIRRETEKKLRVNLLKCILSFYSSPCSSSRAISALPVYYGLFSIYGKSVRRCENLFKLVRKLVAGMKYFSANSAFKVYVTLAPSSVQNLIRCLSSVRIVKLPDMVFSYKLGYEPVQRAFSGRKDAFGVFFHLR